MQQWQRGNEDAFTRIYKKHLAILLKIAFGKTGNFETAREIVQDVFMVFYNKKDLIQDNPLLYLKQVLKFKILEQYRRKGHMKIVPLNDDTDIYGMAEDTISDAIALKEIADKVSKEIQRLPLQQQKVFLMSRQNDMSNKEIAAKLGISVKTVEAHITKALKYLRNHLDYHLVWWYMLAGCIISCF